MQTHHWASNIFMAIDSRPVSDRGTIFRPLYTMARRLGRLCCYLFSAWIGRGTNP